MKVRIGYGLGTAGMAADAAGYGRFIDDLERLKFDSVWFSERINGNAPDPVVAMAFAAGRTTKIKFGMSVMVLPGRNPVLVAKELASLDLLSNGRAEIMAGRGSFIESFPLFGYDLQDYNDLFAEKLELLLKVRNKETITWSGRHRPALQNLSVYPRPVQEKLPIWVAVRMFNRKDL